MQPLLHLYLLAKLVQATLVFSLPSGPGSPSYPGFISWEPEKFLIIHKPTLSRMKLKLLPILLSSSYSSLYASPRAFARAGLTSRAHRSRGPLL